MVYPREADMDGVCAMLREGVKCLPLGGDGTNRGCAVVAEVNAEARVGKISSLRTKVKRERRWKTAFPKRQ
jgi:hypothetical protein